MSKDILQIFEDLANPDRPLPIRPQDLSLNNFINNLVRGNCNLILAGSELASLRADLYQPTSNGFSFGVLAVLGRKSGDIYEFMAENSPDINHPERQDLTNIVGLTRVTLGIIAYAAKVQDSREFTTRINQIAHNSLPDSDDPNSPSNLFIGSMRQDLAPVLENDKTDLSVLPELVLQLIRTSSRL